MRKVHGKSVILGIGMGMIITAIAGLIYSGGGNAETRNQDLSREEVIRLAKSYGMVESIHFLDDDSASATNTGVESNVKGGDKAADTSDKAANTAPNTAQNTAQDTASDTAQNTAPDVSAATGTNSEAAKDQRNITIVIKSGFDSIKVIDMLYEKGIISDKKEFEAVMNSYDASTKITTGSFNFRKNDDYEYVVKTICDIK